MSGLSLTRKGGAVTTKRVETRLSVMSYFRCYLLNASDKIVSVDSLEAQDDVAAMEMAGQLILSKHTDYAAIEVWDCARCVGKVLSPTQRPSLDSILKIS
jgi:hypothetical protein